MKVWNKFDVVMQMFLNEANIFFLSNIPMLKMEIYTSHLFFYSLLTAQDHSDKTTFIEISIPHFLIKVGISITKFIENVRHYTHDIFPQCSDILPKLYKADIIDIFCLSIYVSWQ